jgi:hypothetical protein
MIVPFAWELINNNHRFQGQEKRGRAKVLCPITCSEEVAVHPPACGSGGVHLAGCMRTVTRD